MKKRNIFTIMTGIALVLSFSATAMSRAINPCFDQCFKNHPSRDSAYWQCIGWCKNEQGEPRPVISKPAQTQTKSRKSRRRK